MRSGGRKNEKFVGTKKAGGMFIRYLSVCKLEGLNDCGEINLTWRHGCSSQNISAHFYGGMSSSSPPPFHYQKSLRHKSSTATHIIITLQTTMFHLVYSILSMPKKRRFLMINRVKDSTVVPYDLQVISIASFYIQQKCHFLICLIIHFSIPYDS